MLFQFNSFMTETVICSANQWTGLYMITASVMKELKVRHLRFVCVLQLTIHPVPLLSSTLQYKANVQVFFPFFYFKPLVTLLFIQSFSNNIFTFSVLFSFKIN